MCPVLDGIVVEEYKILRRTTYIVNALEIKVSEEWLRDLGVFRLKKRGLTSDAIAILKKSYVRNGASFFFAVSNGRS